MWKPQEGFNGTEPTCCVENKQDACRMLARTAVTHTHTRCTFLQGAAGGRITFRRPPESRALPI